MAKSRRTNRKASRKNRRGGGYLTDQQYFNPDVLPPSTIMPALSSLPTSTDIRPIMLSTAPMSALLAGGARTRRTRRSRKTRGGFAPSIMGSFIPNAQAAIVPAALYLIYNQFVPKSDSVSDKLKNAYGGKSRKSRRSRK